MENLKENHSPEVLSLRDRVKSGNDKLFKAWLQILEINDKERQFEEDARWYKAWDKLHYLCLELQAKGYEDCLYVENGKKTRLCSQDVGTHWCWVCSSTKFYWRDENAEERE